MQIQQQQGVTLISLMVGMGISMLAILAGITLFRDLITVAVEAKVDASQDGSLAVAVLRAQMELQNTGFGMGRVLNDPLDIHVSADGATVTWRYNDGTNKVCQRLTSGVTDGVYSLDLLRAPTANCTAAGDLETLTFTGTGSSSEKLVAVKFFNMVAAPKVLMTFSLNESGALCSPFASASIGSSSSSASGSGSSSGAVAILHKHPVLTIAKYDAASNESNLAPTSIQRICLANIPRA